MKKVPRSVRNRHAPVLVLLALLCACSSLSEQDSAAEVAPAIHDAIEASAGHFGVRPDIPSPEMIHQLTAEQAEHFLAFFHDPDLAYLSPNRRIVAYMDHRVAGFSYHGSTYTASQAFTHNAGNCLSLAILTTALAKLAGVPIDYQLMDDEPVFQFHNTLVEKGVHIRTRLNDYQYDSAGRRVWLKSRIVIDYFPSGRSRFIGNLTEDDYLARYYHNIANEALKREALGDAYWYAVESLYYAPQSAETLNTLAIINRRAGHIDTAEQIYLYALDAGDNKLTLLQNYRVLLSSVGRNAEADRIQQ